MYLKMMKLGAVNLSIPANMMFFKYCRVRYSHTSKELELEFTICAIAKLVFLLTTNILHADISAIIINTKHTCADKSVIGPK